MEAGISAARHSLGSKNARIIIKLHLMCDAAPQQGASVARMPPLRCRAGSFAAATIRAAARSGDGLPVLDDELEPQQSQVLAHFGSEDGADAGGERTDVPEHHCLEAAATAIERQAKMLIADHALSQDLEDIVEGRRRKPLAPNPVAERLCELETQLVGFERAVAFELPGEMRRRELLTRHGFEGRRESRQRVRRKRKTRRVGVPAETPNRARHALVDKVERVTQVEPGNRSTAAAQLVGRTLREHDRRSMKSVLETGGNDADHALVPARTK